MADRGPRHPHDIEIGAANANAVHPDGAALRQRNHRRDRGDLEIGDTLALQKHPTPHLAAEHAPPVPEWRLRFEERRPVWLREMIAEATGVFCYVYCGTAANATLTLSAADELPQYGSLLTVGIAFGFGIAFALITSAKTSGGHFNPAVSICLAIWSGFPWKKVPRYIFAQIFGGFLATIFVYAQYHQQLEALGAALTAAGRPLVSPTGPAGIFVSLPLPTQSLGSVFINEFLADMFIGLVIVSVLDPTNPFMSGTIAPWAIGLAYTTMVWGFALGTITTNTARDLGARFGAACFYGTGVLTYDTSYAALAALTNIPATFVAWTFYQFVMTDSAALIKDGHATHPEVYKTLTRDREAANAMDGRGGGPTNAKTDGSPTMRKDKDEAEIYHHHYAGNGV